MKYTGWRQNDFNVQGYSRQHAESARQASSAATAARRVALACAGGASGRPASAECRGAWARVTSGNFRHLALQNCTGQRGARLRN
jgi:hypothetical protein